MIRTLTLLLTSLILFAQQMVWDSKESVLNEHEKQQIIESYVKEKYAKQYKDFIKYENELRAYKESYATFQSALKEFEKVEKYSQLMWQDDEDAKTIRRDWQGAKEYCQNLTLGGYTDWYLPSKQELQSIVDKSRTPKIKKEFKNADSSNYWSSSPVVSNSEDAWGVDFNYGYSSYNYKADKRYVRCARAGQ